MYVAIEQIEALIPRDVLAQALSDGDGTDIDLAIWTRVEAAAAAAIDGALAGRYSVPFSAPVPSVIQDAALVFCCEIIYQRRGIPTEQNPFAQRARDCRAALAQIAAGDRNLSTTTAKAVSSGVVIAETSRLGDKLLN